MKRLSMFASAARLSAGLLLGAAAMGGALAGCGSAKPSTTVPSPAPSPDGEPPAVTTPPPAAEVAPALPPILTLPANDEPAVTLAAWFRVGSQDDPAGKEGLAWLTAQMVSHAATTAQIGRASWRERVS
jgi:zinc protease